MADEYDDEQNDDLVPRSQIRALEEKAKKATELEARLAEMERKNIFTEALGDVAKDPRAKYFISGYDGELTPEAIKAEATEIGILSAPRQPEQPEQYGMAPTPQELAAHARMAASAEGVGGDNRISWQEAMAAADRITNEAEREAAILSVVERFGGVTSRTAQ